MLYSNSVNSAVLYYKYYPEPVTERCGQIINIARCILFSFSGMNYFHCVSQFLLNQGAN